jgi:hypothetical protein
MFSVIIPVVDEMLPRVLSQEADLWRHKNGKVLDRINEADFQERICTTQVNK